MTRNFAVGLLMLCVGAVANAQATMTLGDLLDRGAKKLTQAEATQQLSGTTISGTQSGKFPNVTFKNLYAADGTVKGEAWNKGVWFTTIAGKWSVNDKGEFCQELVNDQREKFGSCQSYYVLGNAYYVSASDARSADVRERTISR